MKKKGTALLAGYLPFLVPYDSNNMITFSCTVT